MKLHTLIKLPILMLMSFSTMIEAHPGHEEHSHEPKYVSLSEKDIKFVIEHQNIDLAYIPEIINELFVLLRDIADQAEFTPDLKEFMQLINKGSRVTTRHIAMKGIFGALALLKKYESTLPQSYLDQMCDVLYGYQKSLHKEELVFQGLDAVKHA